MVVVVRLASNQRKPVEKRLLLKNVICMTVIWVGTNLCVPLPETVCGDGTQWDVSNKECVPEIHCFITGFCVEMQRIREPNRILKDAISTSEMPCKSGGSENNRDYNKGSDFVLLHDAPQFFNNLCILERII